LSLFDYLPGDVFIRFSFANSFAFGFATVFPSEGLPCFFNVPGGLYWD